MTRPLQWPAFFVLLLACGRVEGQPSPTAALSASLGTPQARFVGRFDTADPARPRVGWPGSGVVTRFSGTQLDVRLHDEGNSYFQVTVDGAPTQVLRLSRARQVYTIANGLPDGVHEIGVWKRTEAHLGEVEFLGFDAHGGTLSAPSAPTRRIELIGDSITAGYGNAYVPAADAGVPSPYARPCPFSPDSESEYDAYGAIAARALGADHVTLAWSGATTDGMAAMFERTLPGKPQSRWDFHAFPADVVVINLGTNDYSTPRDPGDYYVNSYVELVHKVRGHHPGALVVAAMGPMLTDTYPAGAHALTHARAALKKAVSKLNSDGDAKVVFLEFPQQDAAYGYGCDWHPNARTHRLMADQLTAFLRDKLGW